MINKGMMSSNTPEYETPQWLFDLIDGEFHFEFDVCATSSNSKCGIHYYDKQEDGLSRQWSGVCWMNPPYGKEITKWVEKAWHSAQLGATVVCLVPSRSDTRWWHDYCMKGEIRFIRGRVSFNGSPAPFPSAIVIFKKGIVPNCSSFP